MTVEGSLHMEKSMATGQEFYDGIIAMAETGIKIAMEEGKRAVNIGVLGYQDSKGKERLVKFHFIAEPELFSETSYSTDEDVESTSVGDDFDKEEQKRLQRSVTISQLKMLEAQDDAVNIRH